MRLEQSTRKWKFDNSTTYYFEDNKEILVVLIVSKNKSGYEIEYNNHKTNTYRRTDGLKNMIAVKKQLETYK